MTKKIPLTRDMYAIVDDTDFERVNQHKWCYSGDGYAKRLGTSPHFKTILMHREIIQTPEGMDTDHINGDKLDNRRENLRICTHRENTSNRGVGKNSQTGKVGVYQRKDNGKYRAVLKVNYRQINVGNFDTLEDAVNARDEAARKYRGEFARINQ